MKVQSRWVFVLIGNDRTGKTGIQKRLVKRLAHNNRDYRLDCNLVFDVKHPLLNRKIQTIAIGNRSIQEKTPDPYKSVDDYFLTHFKDADISLVSTHLSLQDSMSILTNGHRKFYNVCAVFFSNSIQIDRHQNAAIAELNWDDRWLVENPLTEDEELQSTMLDAAADSFVQMLIERTRGW